MPCDGDCWRDWFHRAATVLSPHMQHFVALAATRTIPYGKPPR